MTDKGVLRVFAETDETHYDKREQAPGPMAPETENFIANGGK